MGIALLDSRKEQALQHDFVNSKRQQVNQLQMAYINGDLKAGGRRVNTNWIDEWHKANEGAHPA